MRRSAPAVDRRKRAELCQWRCGSSRGFTLIEMTVALAVMSLIMLATVTALRTLGTTQVSLDRLTQRNDEIRSVSMFLRDALESAVIGSDSGGLTLGGGPKDLTVFETTPSSVTWSTALRFGEGTGGSYITRVAREGDAVALRWQLPDVSGQYGDWNKAPARTLITDVELFEVAYRRELGGPWISAWEDGGAPGWIRLRIKAGERFWPDIVMQVAR